MPRRPPRACTQPGCGALATAGRNTCPKHTRAPASNWTRRSSTTERGYGHTWRVLRGMILRRDPVCMVCQARPATQVDHIIPKAHGGTDEETNLRGLCAACHRDKTARDSAAGRARR